MSDATEEWRPIPDSDGLYEVSNLGRVRSLDRIVYRANGKAWRIRGRILAACPDGCGYLQLRVKLFGKRETRKVHRLVLETFVGPRPEGMVGCHNNGNNQDNRLSNLRWDTLAGNAQDMKRHGTHFMSAKTHCIRGHEFTPENTNYGRKSGARLCKTCQQAQGREAYARKLLRAKHAQNTPSS